MLNNFENYGKVKKFIITISIFIISGLITFVLIILIRTPFEIGVPFNGVIKYLILPTLTGENIAVRLFPISAYALMFLILIGFLTGLFAKTLRYMLFSLFIAIAIIFALVGTLKAADAYNENNFIQAKQDGIASKDAHICERIPTMKIAGSLDSSDAIASSRFYRERCYAEISVALKQDLCHEAKDEGVVVICSRIFVSSVLVPITGVTTSSEISLDVCDKASNILSKAICYHHLGVFKQDDHICDKITPLIKEDANERDTINEESYACYTSIEIGNRSSTYKEPNFPILPKYY